MLLSCTVVAIAPALMLSAVHAFATNEETVAQQKVPMQEFLSASFYVCTICIVA